MNVLSLNPGSSSLKYALYRMPEEVVIPLQPPPGTEVRRVADLLPIIGRETVDTIGIRVVHGGSLFRVPVLVDDEVLARIRTLTDLAPLHNPVALEAIERLRPERTSTPIVAVFDTSFHHTLPAVAFTYGLPAALEIRRYGFHGISYSYLASRSSALGLGSKVIFAHLGNGASVCAMRDGVSVDTSMGFTPMEGLIMGTRCGDLDAGALLYLLRAGRSNEELDDLLNHHSGLLGISASSGDVRALEAAATAGNEAAELALDVLAYRTAKYIASYTAALDGVDAIVFSGGIGEHSVSMRQRISCRLRFLGVALDPAANASATGERLISGEGLPVWVIPTNEELAIARQTALLQS